MKFNGLFFKQWLPGMQSRLVFFLQKIGFPQQLLFSLTRKAKRPNTYECIQLLQTGIGSFNKILQVQIRTLLPPVLYYCFHQLLLQPFYMNESNIHFITADIGELIAVIYTGRFDIASCFKQFEKI